MSKIDISVLELLASKICHDLISPIGAVNNGLEIFEELGPDAGEDVTALISFSASQASAKLRAYRIAYGAGGADSSIKPEDVHKAIQDIVGAEDKITQEWDPYADFFPMNEMGERPTGFSKLLVCALLLAMECLPRGGTLRVSGGDNGAIIISGHGENAALKKGFAACIDGKISPSDLEPSMTHPHISALLAQHYGIQLTCAQAGENSVEFSLKAASIA